VGCIRDSWGDERKHYSGERSLHAETMRGRRSCFVAKREVEETNLGMWMTKKREEDNTSSDLYSLAARLDAWAKWKFVPVIVYTLAASLNAFREGS